MIEEALYAHLQEQEKLYPFLATYAGQMAIFNQVAPPDTDEEWETASQYGRIIFAVDLTEDPERKYSGTLMVDVSCEDGMQNPDEMEPLVRELIDGYFFSSDDVIMAAQWSASNYFTEPTEKVVGVTLTFGLLAFNRQRTIEPDPIALMNRWAARELSRILGKGTRVIGYDDLEDAWKPTNEAPAIYWRLAQINPCGWIADTYNCSWHTATIYGHIMAPDRNVCASITRMIDNCLTIKRRLIFDDKSPLMVDRNIRINLSNDPLRVGQITIDATYGILYIPRPSEPIQNIDVRGKEDTEWHPMM